MGKRGGDRVEQAGREQLSSFFFFRACTTAKRKDERKKISTPQRFELWRAEPNRFLIYLLNHSDMVSSTGSNQESLTSPSAGSVSEWLRR